MPATAENIALFIKTKVCELMGEIYALNVVVKVAEALNRDYFDKIYPPFDNNMETILEREIA